MASADLRGADLGGAVGLGVVRDARGREYVVELYGRAVSPSIGSSSVGRTAAAPHAARSPAR